jgi:hypothetical protein
LNVPLGLRARMLVVAVLVLCVYRCACAGGREGERTGGRGEVRAKQGSATRRAKQNTQL